MTIKKKSYLLKRQLSKIIRRSWQRIVLIMSDMKIFMCKALFARAQFLHILSKNNTFITSLFKLYLISDWTSSSLMVGWREYSVQQISLRSKKIATENFKYLDKRMSHAVSYRFNENIVFATTVGITQDTEFILPSFCITLKGIIT